MWELLVNVMLTSEKRASTAPFVYRADAPPWEPAGRTLKNCNDRRSQLSENHPAASLAGVRAAAIRLSPLSYIPIFTPPLFTEHKRFLRCISWGSCCEIKLNIIVELGKEYDARVPARRVRYPRGIYIRVADKSFNSDESTKLWEFQLYLASWIAKWNRVRPIESAIKYFRHR